MLSRLLLRVFASAIGLILSLCNTLGIVKGSLNFGLTYNGVKSMVIIIITLNPSNDRIAVTLANSEHHPVTGNKTWSSMSLHSSPIH